MSGFNTDGKLELAWDATKPLRRDDGWVGVEQKARAFVERNAPDPDLILEMLGLKTPGLTIE
jgi:hypothetical protein